MSLIKDTDQVKDFYNKVENLDSEFRQNSSRIKGLRAFNNWIKCVLIYKFAKREFETKAEGKRSESQGLRVLEIGCGKGGDLHKWHKAPEKVKVYVGLDPADVSIQQAQARWEGYQKTLKHGTALSRAEFYAQDCFGETIGSIPVIKEVGFNHDIRVGGGFDIVSMMFSMHYAFESEEKVERMLKNIASSLKIGGKLIGCVPDSDVIEEQVREFHAEKEPLLEDPTATASWGNDIYNVRFAEQNTESGVFPTFGHKYFFTLAEAVEAPEYVVPWDIFCSIAEEYGLLLTYCKPFHEVWAEERENKFLARLSKEMGVQNTEGTLLVSPQEMEVAGFYMAFVFQKF